MFGGGGVLLKKYIICDCKIWSAWQSGLMAGVSEPFYGCRHVNTVSIPYNYEYDGSTWWTSGVSAQWMCHQKHMNWDISL